ncbi:MAG TPA: hypothetical protein VMT12_09755, partial [Syntrophales bacterium]|nr:hypothetical protein [Syntrophales bacterium]
MKMKNAIKDESHSLSDDLFKQGEAFFGEGRCEEAKQCFLSVLEKDPCNTEALNNLGVIIYGEGNIKTAAELFLRVLSIDPYYRDATLNLTHALRMTDQLPVIEPFLRKLVQRNPQDEGIRNILDEIDLLLHQGTHKISMMPVDKLRNVDYSLRKAESIYIEISGLCNGRCLYCAQSRLREAKNFGSIISASLFERILKRLLELNIIDRSTTNSISLYIWGEPFLNPQINDILQILRKNDLYARISSNFIKSPEIESKNLPTIGVLTFSLSGFSQDSYGKIHGASLSKTLENFEHIYEKLRIHSPETLIYIAWHRYLFNESEFWD